MEKKHLFFNYPIQLIIVLSILASGCKKNDNEVPALSTISVTKITYTTAKSGGKIASDGGTTIIESGVCWSTIPNPSIVDNKTTDDIESDSFTSNIIGLTANTTYYVRAYATNSSGTGYGSEVSFSTQANSFTDPRDGNVYKTIIIGDQVWMAENLKYLPKVVGPGTSSWTTPCYYVYDYNGTNVDDAMYTSNYTTYGVLYNWNAAKISCPIGWHLPNDTEWEKLLNYLANNGYNYDGTIGGGSSKIAKSMASASGWCHSSIKGAIGNTDYPSYINKCGFSALQGQSLNSSSISPHFTIGGDGYWWSATVSDTPNYAGYITMNCNSSMVIRSLTSMDFGFSVRCVKD